MCCLNNGLPHHFSFTKKEREKNCEVKHFLISNICRNNWSTAITISFKTNASHFQSNAHQSRKQLMYCCHEKTAKVEKNRYAAFKRLFRNKYWQHWPMALWRVFLFFSVFLFCMHLITEKYSFFSLYWTYMLNKNPQLISGLALQHKYNMQMNQFIKRSFKYQTRLLKSLYFAL